MTWSCSHCGQPERRHALLGKDPGTGQSQLECLFDASGAPLLDRLDRLHAIIEDRHLDAAELSRVHDLMAEGAIAHEEAIGRTRAYYCTRIEDLEAELRRAREGAPASADLQTRFDDLREDYERLCEKYGALGGDAELRERIAALIGGHPTAPLQRIKELEELVGTLAPKASGYGVLLEINRELERRLAELAAASKNGTPSNADGMCAVGQTTH